MLFPAATSPREPVRVVITGAGIVTALGVGWRSNSDGFRAGRTAFRPVSLFDVSRHRAKTAAEADLLETLPHTRLDSRRLGRLDRAGRMLLLAAHEAWNQAGWEPAENVPLVLGTTAGGMMLGEAYFRQALHNPHSQRGQAFRAVCYQPQVQARLAMEALNFSGPISIVSNACASGGNAIGQAWQMIRSGQAARAVAGGFDSLCEMVYAGFDSLQALSTTVCRPFDARRDGLALGEGAGVIMLETLESASRRGANILGEITGYASSIDQHHLTQPHPQGSTTQAVMKSACATAGVTPENIGYINAHGTGTVLNDSSEAMAITEWAGARAASLPVSSTKANIGHLLGAAGAVEAVVCLMALREQWLPPEIAFEVPDPACKFPVVHQPQDARVEVALSNSFGFGGVNATLIFRRWA
ncbi:MAG TPA: beta-ketoacyl-[acyl-carrier-protein] synthase family protein [Verrucomicrobiae bacterium]|jgi:3-oxoacyl-[acyl-carrier-protein] synthase II|nr:beta-ketoacyl-[acyl-carrier-protein] synthase family protein [Verrucomicrobiae bacterium]